MTTHRDENLLAGMKSIARETGALLKDYFHQRVKIEYKGDVDLVTVADRAAEKLITQRIHESWPDHGIVGEEGTRTNPDAEFRWYVDPLDGTTNFAHGFPVFCVSLGLERAGELFAGVVYDPTRDELFAAMSGKGATLNGEPMHVSATPKIAESIIATGFPSQKRHKNPNIHFYHHITLKSHGVRRAGSAAIDLVYTASGRFDGYWEFNLNAWDVCAGALIVEEAGGRVTNISGGKFDHRVPKEIMATNGLIHQELIDECAAVLSGKGLGDLPSAVEYAKKGTY